MSSLFTPLVLAHGPALRNRFFLAPLTNCQSHVDGTLSDDEYRWLTLRAQGGFAVTTTCASHVQSNGQGFPGQLGNFSEAHLPGLRRLAAGIRQAGSLAVTQLHHAGIRAPRELIGIRPVGPSEDAESGARALSAGEVEQVAEDFIVAAQRADRAGFDGIEVHGAHGYLLCQFLSAEANRREDRYGGSLENRARLLFDVVAGIRTRCRAGFIVGVRLSPERFGLKVAEVQAVAQRLMREGAIDYLNLSLWDIFKEPADEALRGRSLLSYFVELERGAVRIGAAGRIMSGPDAAACLAAGADFAIIGRAAILHHDFPERVRADPGFRATATPVAERYLRAEGLGAAMIEYMRRWEGFVEA